MSLLKSSNKFKFIYYKRKGRKFLLKKKFINPFLIKFNNFILKKDVKIKNRMSGIFLKNANFGLYSIYHFAHSYNIWYNKLIIQKSINFNVQNSRYLLTDFRGLKNKLFSHHSLAELLKSVFSQNNKFNKRLSVIDRILKKNLKYKKFSFLVKNLKKKKRNLFRSLRYKTLKMKNKKIKKIIKKKIYFDFNFNCINFHKIFLNIISKIGHQLSCYYDSFYNLSDSHRFPIKNDHLSLKEKNSSKDRFLNQLNILFAFVKEKFLIVNLIDPAIGLNLYSSHPAMSRRGMSRFFSLSQKEQMSKYVFLFKLKKKKALKNKFLRTLTILGASRRLFSIQRTNPRVLNFILNIPRHIIDKTLYYSFAFFIKPFPSLDIPIEDIRQRLDYDPSRDKRRIKKYQLNSNTYFKNYKYTKNFHSYKRQRTPDGYKHNLITNLKKKNFSSLILKFLTKYLFFLNCKNFGNLFFNKKRNLYFFLFIFTFVLKRIRLFIVLVLRNTSYIRNYFKIYKKKLGMLKYLLKFFIISYKLQLPYQEDILRLLKLKSKEDRMQTLKTLPIYKTFGKLKKLEKYFMKNILKTFRRFPLKSQIDLKTKIHNIVFTSRQSHGALLKISKNRRI